MLATCLKINVWIGTSAVGVSCQEQNLDKIPQLLSAVLVLQCFKNHVFLLDDHPESIEDVYDHRSHFFNWNLVVTEP